MHTYLETEFQPGVVIHIDPATLIASGVHVKYDASIYDSPVEEPHFFLLTKADRGILTMRPLFTNPGTSRQVIETDEKLGHSAFVDHATYVDFGQSFVVSKRQLMTALDKGNDLSTLGARNRVTSAGLERLNVEQVNT